MTGELSDDALSLGREFWESCARLLRVYPQRPPTLSGEAEPKQLERQLKSLLERLVPLLCPNDTWLTDASIGKGGWAAIPWVAVFDARESRSAQQGVYPVIHLSSEEPVGIRIGLGVSTTAFKSREDEKAAEVRQQLTDSEREKLTVIGFTDVVAGDEQRVSIGAGNLARKYSKGMIFERFVPIAELESSPGSLTESLRTLIGVYKTWVDRTARGTNTDWPSFLQVMERYAAERIVFLSPSREARYFISDVDATGCTVNRLDSNDPVRVTVAGFQAKLDWLMRQTSQVTRSDLDGTVAKHTCYLQAAEISLAADKKSIVYLANDQTAADHFASLVEAIVSPQKYKPVILAVLIEAVRNGDLTQNRIQFDWLVPRFISRMRQHGTEVSEQQAAEGFGRLAGDLFWLLAHHDPAETLSTDKPTPSHIRGRISYASLQEPFWRVLQNREYQRRILNVLAAKWWPAMTADGDTKAPGAERAASLGQAAEQLITDIARQGFIYQPWQIATYITAVRTKPFVILAGVSGTGKSKLPVLVSELTGGAVRRVSVRPDWTDSSDVLGYVDLNDTFRPGVVLEEARAASDDRGRYHVCLIDEMNLARVEHYFAEVLSTIEDRSPADGGGFESGALITQNLPVSFAGWQKQNIPPNLGIVGTVNMDESSHGFSRKVLDRAFTIELSEVDLRLTGDTDDQSAAVDVTSWPLEFWQCPATRVAELDLGLPYSRECVDKTIKLLIEVNHCLVHSQLQVGYRTRDEIVLFLVNANDVKGTFRTRDGSRVDPLDLAIMMKILPRLVGGSNAIRKTLTGLMGLASGGNPLTSEDQANDMVTTWENNDRSDAVAGARLPRTAARLCLMWDRLSAEGYTSFWL